MCRIALASLGVHEGADVACGCGHKVLAGGEAIDMPVVFYVDPDLAEDSDLAHVRTITLSYTFFPKGGSRRPVAAVDRAKQPQGKL